MMAGYGGRTWLAAVALAAAASGCGLHGKPQVERRAAGNGAAGAGATSKLPAPSTPAGPGQAGLDTVVAPGIVEPWGGQVALSARESGWIARIAVKEGERVEAGQLLATLDDPAQRRAVELAAAELTVAAAELSRLDAGATPEERRQAQAELDGAAARSELARSAAARAARLHQQGAISDAEVERDSAEARAQGALADRSEARLQEVRLGARTEDRSAARGRVAAARARLGLAEAGLDRRRVFAPSAGTVLLSRFHAGEFYDVGAGPLFLLGDLDRLQVRLEVDEIDAIEVGPGAPCMLRSDGGVPLAEGTVDRVAPRMGRRGLAIESPTSRSDVRVREVFVQVGALGTLVPGQRVWGHTPRASPTQAAVGTNVTRHSSSGISPD